MGRGQVGRSIDVPPARCLVRARGGLITPDEIHRHGRRVAACSDGRSSRSRLLCPVSCGVQAAAVPGTTRYGRDQHVAVPDVPDPQEAAINLTVGRCVAPDEGLPKPGQYPHVLSPAVDRWWPARGAIPAIEGLAPEPTPPYVSRPAGSCDRAGWAGSVPPRPSALIRFPCSWWIVYRVTTDTLAITSAYHHYIRAPVN